VTTLAAQPPQRTRMLESVHVREAMHRGIVSAAPESSLFAVARLLAAHRIHAVVVGEEDGRWGLVSDLDLAAAAADGLLGEATAGSIASSPRPAVRPGETLARAAQLMREYETHHLVVVAPGSERPVGILSTLDIAAAIADARQDRTP
jgi:CBS domain-containing protein